MNSKDEMDADVKDVKPNVTSLGCGLLPDCDSTNQSNSSCMKMKDNPSGMERGCISSGGPLTHDRQTPSDLIPVNSFSDGEVKEEIMYCPSCPYNAADSQRLRSHLFEHHPTVAAVVTNCIDEGDCSPHDVKLFCVKQTCTFSTSACKLYEEHLMSCCPVYESLSEDEKGRLVSTFKFILDFQDKHSLSAVAGFLDYVARLSPLFSHSEDEVRMTKDPKSNNFCPELSCSVVTMEKSDSQFPTPVLLFSAQNSHFTGSASSKTTSHIDNFLTVGKQETEDNDMCTTDPFSEEDSSAEEVRIGQSCDSRVESCVKRDIVGKSVYSNSKLGQDIESEHSTDNQKVIAWKGEKNVYTVSSNTKSQVTVLASMSAACFYLPPLLIYPDSGIPGGNLLEGFPEALLQIQDEKSPNDVDALSQGSGRSVLLTTETQPDSYDGHLDSQELEEDSRIIQLDQPPDSGSDSSEEFVVNPHESSESVEQVGMDFPASQLKASLPSSSHEETLKTSGNEVSDDVHDLGSLTSGQETSFPCDECGKIFGKKGNLIKHVRRHRGDRSFICNECGKSFTEKSNLIRHVRMHTGEKPFKCDECDKTFGQNSSLLKHMKTHTKKINIIALSDAFYGNKTLSRNMRLHNDEKPFKCDHCGQGFGQKNNLINHIRIHTGEKPFKCNACGKSFSEKSNLLRHIRTHTGEKPFRCDECGKMFGQSSNLRKHMRTHTGEKPFICNACGKSFGRNTNLLKHIRTHTGEKPYKCKECGKSYGQNSNLVKHIRTHTGEKPFKCSECGKSFSQNTYLINHMRSHTGDKPFHCPECGKSFSQNGNLFQHMKTHSGERPFTCNECNSTFCYKVNLIKHMRKHTGEKPFTCDECGKSFQRNTSFVEHKRTHTGEKPFTCSACGKSFRQMGNLFQHMKRHTGGEKPFVCNKCGMGFHQKSRLIRHIRTHTGDMPFKCHHCCKGFPHHSKLITHMRTHSGEKPFKCDECGRSFRLNSTLVAHKKSHTKEKSLICKECGENFHLKSLLKRHVASHATEKPFKCKECSKTFSQKGHLLRHAKTHSAHTAET